MRTIVDMITAVSIHDSLRRQVTHWQQAATRLSGFDNITAPYAWQGLDHTMAALLRNSMKKSVDAVLAYADNLQKQLDNAKDPDNLKNINRSLLLLKERYLRAEETIHFYSVAINSRTTPGLTALLRACDILCLKSLQEALQPLGHETPHVLTYVDKGVGASILKAGLRLWDGNISSVAAIKVTQHNLYRPTAIIHEAGHQLAHVLNWNEELSSGLRKSLTGYSTEVSEAFAGWSSEMAADAFAFVHTGFAAVAALHDVVAGSPQSVFAYHPYDPHPISYIRVLLNIEMCKQLYGQGPWNNLEEAFKYNYAIDQVNLASANLITQCIPALPGVVDLLLQKPYRAFGNSSLARVISPERVSPHELERLEKAAGPALFTSHAWIWKESLRLLALVGYKIGTGQGDLPSLYKLQEGWMTNLGAAVSWN